MTVANPLPTMLGKSPLVEALFELRFSGGTSASSVLPGFLFTQLKCSEILRMPHADIPDQIRQADPNLVYLPIVRLKWEQYYISIGDRSLVISSGHPYSGWVKFKTTITKILESCQTLEILGKIERFSLKYIDIFDMPGFSATGEGLALKISSPLDVNPLATHLKIEIPEGDQHHIVQLFGEAQGTLPNGIFKKGLMLDVDSIQNTDGYNFDSFMEKHHELLDDLHSRNEEIFFKLISESGLTSLEPKHG